MLKTHEQHGAITELLKEHKAPCLSLYQPTFRHYPENRQDPIRFRNLLRNLEESLGQKFRKTELEGIIKPFRRLADRRDFWNHTLDGLAVLGCPGFFKVIKLQYNNVPEQAIVADSFHIKPLLRALQLTHRYQVLAVNREEARLYEGTRNALDQISMAPEVPRTITDALGEELTESHETVASYGQGAKGPAMHHGHGARKDELDKDEERFFRAVDRAITEHHSRPSGLPLYLAALPEHHALFREVSKNPFLMDEGIDVHPNGMEMEDFRERVWQVIEPRYNDFLKKMVEDFGEAKAKGLGTADPREAATAAVAGRVATLLLEEDRQIPGSFDESTGEVELAELEDPEVDDMLDDLGELVLKKGGRLHFFPRDRMPTSTGIAAIYRY